MAPLLTSEHPFDEMENGRAWWWWILATVGAALGLLFLSVVGCACCKKKEKIVAASSTIRDSKSSPAGSNESSVITPCPEDQKESPPGYTASTLLSSSTMLTAHGPLSHSETMNTAESLNLTSIKETEARMVTPMRGTKRGHASGDNAPSLQLMADGKPKEEAEANTSKMAERKEGSIISLIGGKMAPPPSMTSSRTTGAPSLQQHSRKTGQLGSKSSFNRGSLKKTSLETGSLAATSAGGKDDSRDSQNTSILSGVSLVSLTTMDSVEKSPAGRK